MIHWNFSLRLGIFEKKFFLFGIFFQLGEVFHCNTDISVILKVVWLMFLLNIIYIPYKKPIEGFYNWKINVEVTDRTKSRKAKLKCLPATKVVHFTQVIIRNRFKHYSLRTFLWVKLIITSNFMEQDFSQFWVLRYKIWPQRFW